MRYLPLPLLLITFPAPAKTVHHGKVVRIVDGDTLVLLVDEKQKKIRLSDIDTPEKKQPSGGDQKQEQADRFSAEADKALKLDTRAKT